LHSYRRQIPKRFAKEPLADRLHDDLVAAMHEADSRPIDDWSSASLERSADEIVAINALRPLDLRLDERFVEEMPIVNPRQRGGGVTELIALKIPHRSQQGYFSFIPSVPPRTPFYGDVDANFVTLEYFASQDPREVKRMIAAQTSVLVEWVDAINDDIGRAATRMRAAVLERLRSRAAGRRKSRDLIQALELPTAPVPIERAMEIPAEPRSMELAQPDTPSGGWTLADHTYELVLDTVIRFGNAMERRSRSAKQLIPDEETLRDWIVFILNSNFQREDEKDMFTVGEAANGKGKTDILTRQDGKNVFIGECKFWKGAAAFTSGIDQLFGYLGWRDLKAALILFIKEGDASQIIEKAHAQILAHPSFLSEASTNTGSERRDYLMTSTDNAIMVKLALIPMVMTGA
jgi:hypothetical protein